MKLFSVIFDLDGTILDSEKIYGKVFKEMLATLGREVKTSLPHKEGMGIKDNWNILLIKFKIKTSRSIEDLARQTEDQFIKLLPEVRIREGFVDLVSALKRDFIKIALATSTDKRVVEEVFKIANIKKYFDVVVTGDMVRHKKPAPDLFLLAAKKLKSAPVNCIAIEDSQAGLDSAKRAGMKVIMVTGERRVNSKHIFRNSDMKVASFRELSPERIFELQ